MAKANKITKKVNLKKDLRMHVSQSLKEMFKDFEPIVGKRKFQRNIKKASKELITSVKPGKLNVSAEISEAKQIHGNGIVPTNVSRVAHDSN